MHIRTGRLEQLRDVSCAWYQREITIPREWSGRRVVVSTEYLNSFATVFVDGNKVGEMRFPRGEVELTSVCQPGGRYLLSLQVTAMPLKAVMMSFSDTASARKVKGSVEHRGLCGDVWLLSTPPGERIVDVKIEPSVREGELGIRAELEGLNARTSYALKAIVRDASGRPVKEFTSQLFKGGDPKDGHMAFTEKWETARLWDLNTPKNQYSLQLSLLDGEGLAADTYLPVRFGFRELWIDGRDIYLNGTRIFLSAVPLDNAQLGAAWSTYEAARESLLRLMIYGVNFVYLHNYDCTPGAHLSVEEILRAADDVGILVALTQPHFGHYEWDAADADEQNGYAQHAAFYVHVAQNHPSVVFYSTSHNSTTDSEDMNPDLVGRDYRAVGDWALKNREKASRAEAIIRRLDPTRVVYHHSGGNFGAMHTINFYTNWVPAQEMSDWFGRWSKEGIKPVFTCEYGVPESWDWAMYRGWYKRERAFGDANVPWEFCLAEWNSQFIGDKAFQISEMEKRNLRWEAREFKAGHVWHRWDYPHALGSNDFPERDPIFAMYLRDVWRAHRTWGLSGMNFWDNSLLYRPRAGLARNLRRDLETDWEQLQRPGFSPDFLEQRNERMDLAYDREDWIPTEAGMALLRNNQPLLAYIGGKSDVFTSKDHNLVAGETVEKQIIIINNSRETVTCDCDWNFALPHPVGGSKQVSVKTGDQARIPLRFEVLAGTATGAYELNVSVKFSTGEVQKDAFIVHVMAPPAVPVMSGKVALFDPKGETKGLLDGLKIALPVGRRQGGSFGLRYARCRQGSADRGRSRAGSEPREGRPESNRLRAEPGGVAASSGLSSCGLRPEKGLSSRARPSASGWIGCGLARRLAWRVDNPAAAADLRQEPRRQLRSNLRVVRDRGDAPLPLREPRERCFVADREAGSRRLPARHRRRLQPPIRSAAGIPRRPGDNPVLPDGRDGSHRERSRGRDTCREHHELRSGLAACAAPGGGVRRRHGRKKVPGIGWAASKRLRWHGLEARPVVGRRPGGRNGSHGGQGRGGGVP